MPLRLPAGKRLAVDDVWFATLSDIYDRWGDN